MEESRKQAAVQHIVSWLSTKSPKQQAGENYKDACVRMGAEAAMNYRFNGEVS